MLLAVSLSSSPCYAQLDVIQSTVGRIENRMVDVQGKVNTIQSRTGTILNNTNGLQELVGNVRGITAELPEGLFEKVAQGLEEAAALLELANAEVAAATANKANHPDLLALVTGLQDLLQALLGDAGSHLDLGVLNRLLNVLPEPVLAVAGQGLLTAGLNQAAVQDLQKTARDLPLLRQAVEAEWRTESLSVYSGPSFVESGSGCTFDDMVTVDGEDVALDRTFIRDSAYSALVLGGEVKLLGKIVHAGGKTTASGNFTKNIRAGIHGYASLNIENDFSAILGNLIEGVGDGLIAAGLAGVSRLRHCEVLVYQQTLLEEMCTLSRFRSDSCKRWALSAERDALGD
jgi:hypothetical protein